MGGPLSRPRERRRREGPWSVRPWDWRARWSRWDPCRWPWHSHVSHVSTSGPVQSGVEVFPLLHGIARGNAHHPFPRAVGDVPLHAADATVVLPRGGSGAAAVGVDAMAKPDLPEDGPLPPARGLAVPLPPPAVRVGLWPRLPPALLPGPEPISCVAVRRFIARPVDGCSRGRDAVDPAPAYAPT